MFGAFVGFDVWCFACLVWVVVIGWCVLGFLGVGYAVGVGSDLIWLVLDLLSLVWWYFVVCGFGCLWIARSGLGLDVVW